MDINTSKNFSINWREVGATAIVCASTVGFVAVMFFSF
jgi:hypothetical protein